MTDMRAVLAQLESRLGASGEDAVPLEGGITNRNYLVRFGGRRCVVRLAGKDTAVLGISREAERLANAAAAALGIGPEVVFAGEGFLVTEFVDAAPAGSASLSATPEPAAAALRRFHASGITLPVRFWVPDLLSAYVQVILGRGAEPPEWFEWMRSLVARVADALPAAELVPSHNDLLPANLLWRADGTIVLVDWEYAGMGHPLFDLANLAVNAQFGPEAEARLLSAYLGEPASAPRAAALRLMRIVSDAREAAWGAVQKVVSDIDFDFAVYAEEHFQRLSRAAAGADFERWLDAAAA